MTFDIVEELENKNKIIVSARAKGIRISLHFYNNEDATRCYIATTIFLNSSHASLVIHPHEIAELILNATKGKTK
jgi:hypothetical protein